MTQRDSVNGRENTAGMFLFFSSLFFHRLIFSREGNLNGSVRVVEIIVEFTIYVYAYATSFGESWRNISLTQAQLCTMEKLKIQLESFQGIKLNNTRYAGTKRISRGK